MNSKTAKAFAPGNVSLIFVIKRTKKPETSGSLGLGFTTKQGVTVTVKQSNATTIYFNNKKTLFPTVQSTIEKLTKNQVEVKIKTTLPLSSGFGISGASSLATAYALNKLLNLKKSKLQLAKIAHAADVKNLTGLGDVTNQYFGGVLLKTVSSAQFNAKKINLKAKTLYYKTFSKLDTKKVISNNKIKSKINSIGLKKIKKIIKSNTMNTIITISKEFAEESGLLKNSNVIKTINKIEKNKGFATMIMLGNAVLSTKKFPGSKRIEISSKGAHLLKQVT